MKKMIPAITIFLSACATSSAYLDIGGAKWRKSEAFSAELFSVGVIETTGRNRFDPKGKVILDDFSIDAKTTFHSETTATASIEAEGKLLPDITEISGELKAKKEERLKGKYVVFRNTDTYGLIEKLNSLNNSNALVNLKQEHNPVIVTGVAIVYNNENSEKSEFNADTKAIFNSSSGSPAVSLKGTSGSQINTYFSDGTVFAYEYSQIEWDNTSKIPKVKKLTVDRPENSWF